MPHAKHHILWPDGEHPSLELLRQYQHGNLPAALHHQLERHVLGCALCADVLEGMELSDAGKTKVAVADINQRVQAKVQQRKKKTAPLYWQSAAAILILVASAVLVLYYNYKEQQPALQEIAKEEAVVEPEAAPLLDLSQPSAATEADSMAIPQIPKASIAAVESQRKYTSPVVKQDVEEVYDQEEFFYMDMYPEDTLIDDKPLNLGYFAGIDKVEKKQSVEIDSIAFHKKPLPTMALAPESVDVSKALAGKAAGVTIRGVSTIKSIISLNQKQVSGQVLSEEGEPLPGVAVLLKGKAIGTVTDAEGKYSLATPDGEQTLRFSFIGYETAEKALAQNDTSADITLTPDQRALSEVVVIAYGTAKAHAIIPAKPVGGMRKYKKYVKENSRPVPEQGKVKIVFTVAEDGKPQQLRVEQSLCAACDAEALRLVQEGPLWKPASQNGQPIPQEVKVTVKFKN
ncbi:TonB family protein [uncultured Pontibacter sp.]|uniref:TonB family protein n=1 Tax=uncultured Pontibacter sp. TaxID=453356 RepID=UPI002613D58C|nr:TonB family protein [uncultured Pontibacter sp.]